MRNISGIIALLSVVVFIAGSCASREGKVRKAAEPQVVKQEVVVKPARHYEECLELIPGKVMEYQFSSSAPVKFNVHYHGMEGIHYPVKKDAVSEGSGKIDPRRHDFYIEDQEFYCLMWTNSGAEPVRVSFECLVRDR